MAENSVESSIAAKLRAAFSPLELLISNESVRHQGHSGHKSGAERETGETHFRVKLVSAEFSGRSAKERHRAVYHVLEHELRHKIHALALELKAPSEV